MNHGSKLFEKKKKIPQYGKKQSLNLVRGNRHLHSIYIVFTTIYIYSIIILGIIINLKMS